MAYLKKSLLINRLQITLRQRKLNYEENRQLYDLIKETTDDQVKCCAFLLLNLQDEAQKLLDSFDEQHSHALKTIQFIFFITIISIEISSAIRLFLMFFNKTMPEMQDALPTFYLTYCFSTLLYCFHHKECARDSPCDRTATCFCKVPKADRWAKRNAFPKPSDDGLFSYLFVE